MRPLRLLAVCALLAMSGCSSSPGDVSVGDSPDGAPSEGSSDATDAAGSPSDSFLDSPADGAVGPRGQDAPPPEDAETDAQSPADDATLQADASDGGATADDALDSAAVEASTNDAPPDGAAQGSFDASIDAAVDSPPLRDAPLDEGAGDATPSDASSDSTTGPIDAASDATASLDGPGDAPAPDALDASAADGADAEIVVPVLEDGGHYVFASGDLSLEIDPTVGGRVVSFARAGLNVLTGPGANAINYGSTFWTSPQSDWNWPPPPEIDNQPYAATVDGGALTLQGANNSALGVAITKVFSFDPVRGAVTIAYTIENIGSSPRSFAPWEVTRVFPDGLMFFPTGPQAYSADSGPALPTQQAGGATWFAANDSGITSDVKFFANAARGWLAQERSGLVFVKKFSDVPVSSEAPGEAEVEIFVSGTGAYVELEDQGGYQPIAAGSSLGWTVTWFLVPLPATVDGGLGDPSLVAFVDSLSR